MAYVIVENFNQGLDRRRKQVAGAPGTLWDCINAHITRGGEIDKRKAFVLKYTLPAGTFGMQAASDLPYVFGSGVDPGVPVGVTYQRLQHPDTVTAMTQMVMSEVFDGKSYVIAKFSDGSIHHYYDGVMVADWDNGIVRADMTNSSGVAQHLRQLIAADPAYSATVVGNVITIEAAVAGAPMAISAQTLNVDGGVDDQSVAIAETQSNVSGSPETLATSAFQVTNSTVNAGVNKITSLTVNGVSIIVGAFDSGASPAITAALIASSINSAASSPDYTAVASGNIVTISAAVGSGAGANGLPVAVGVGGTVTVSTATAMSGGVAVVPGQKQINTATIGGTFEVGDRFNITIDEKTFGYVGNPSVKGTTALTFKSKLNSSAGSLVEFSDLNDASRFNSSLAGAGFQNMGTQDGGSSTLTALAGFLGNMVAFSSNTTQIWAFDTDPANNSILQSLRNIGTKAQRSIQPMGNNDLFFLDQPGVRSLRAFFATSLAMLSDVGTPIDTIIQAAVTAVGSVAAAAAVSIIEPDDKRYWLAIGTTIYVFSLFPSAKISAWSTYDVGFQITDLSIIGGKVYARAGDAIYVYGGDDGATYDTGPSDAYQVTVTLPFLTAGKPATVKEIVGYDAAVTGTWDVYMMMDPRNTARIIKLGTINNVTYPDQLDGASGETTHFAPKFICNTPGPATISNLAIEYTDGTNPDPLQPEK